MSLNPTALKEQFRQLRGLALAFRENSVDTLEAWQQAILETQAASRRRAAYPVSALLPVLQRYAAYTGSTSGVEQDFSRLKRAIGDHRGNLGSLAEERIAVLASRRTSVDEDLVLAKHAPDLGRVFRRCPHAAEAKTFAAPAAQKGQLAAPVRGSSDRVPPESAGHIDCQ